MQNKTDKLGKYIYYVFCIIICDEEKLLYFFFTAAAVLAFNLLYIKHRLCGWRYIAHGLVLLLDLYLSGKICLRCAQPPTTMICQNMRNIYTNFSFVEAQFLKKFTNEPRTNK